MRLSEKNPRSMKRHHLVNPMFGTIRLDHLTDAYTTQVIAQESLERWFPNRMLRSVFFGK